MVYKEESQQSRECCCLRWEGGRGRSWPCPVPSRMRMALQRDCHAGRANPCPSCILWNPCGFLMSCHLQAIFTQKKHPQKTPQPGNILHFEIRTFLAFLLSAVIYFQCFFPPPKLQARKGKPCKSDASNFPTHAVGTLQPGDIQISPWYSSLVFPNSISS